MSAILIVLGICFLIGALVCGFSIFMDAFDDELWKGLMCLLFWPYMIWYAFAEYDCEGKWVRVALWMLGGTVGGTLIVAGRMMA